MIWTLTAVAVLKVCHFESGNCAGWTNLGSKEKWKFSQGKKSDVSACLTVV